MNEIEWQDWDKSTFMLAKEKDKPIIIFLTRQGCESCDKMELESFSNSKEFIFVKIDSDMRSDIDRYLHEISYQMNSQKSGYPLILFITPDKIPLYSTGYVTNHGDDGMMGMSESMELVSSGYHNNRDTFTQNGKKVLLEINSKPSDITATKINDDFSEIIKNQLRAVYDEENGGFGNAPKFPRHSVFELLMDIYEKDRDEEFAMMLKNSIDKFLIDSLLDKSDNAFCQCCLDKDCQQLDISKKLCNNALISKILLRAGGLLGYDRYTQIALKNIEFINSHMKSKKSVEILAHNAIMSSVFLDAGKYEGYYKALALDLLSDIQENFMLNGKVYRYINNNKRIDGMLDDYVYLAWLMLEAYESTKEEHYKAKASKLINTMLEYFFNSGLWLYANSDIVVKDTIEDGECPSTSGMATLLLQKASKLIDIGYEKFYQRSLEVNSYKIMREPLSVATISRAAYNHKS